MVNASMTHYKKARNNKTRIDEWVKTVYNNVIWQGGQGSRFNKGFIDSNDVKIRLSYANNDLDIDNFKIGDIIVKGEHGDIETQQDLTNSYNITSIIDNNFGSRPHIHIEGK